MKWSSGPLAGADAICSTSMIAPKISLLGPNAAGRQSTIRIQELRGPRSNGRVCLASVWQASLAAPDARLEPARAGVAPRGGLMGRLEACPTLVAEIPGF